VPLAWRVEETAGAIGLAQQCALLDRLAAWLPSAVAAGAGVLAFDRLYGTPGLAACAARGWDHRLRLRGSLRVFVPGHAASARVADLAKAQPCLTDVELTAPGACAPTPG
jgi:hypothetical protein